ncbi:MAG: AarF/ABC1/UbiB kinase family protein [Ardenticatenaceae bacterium]|nr:AarF/ABC1/UbiB kinase family protein [Anaerolineales bacterium]MCB8923053.1 AarF/ABC1/UbiB kinase family protein [Ardenticatenaceae bacterium]MCB8992082.1 AarF/ABC1/UbiB kinase family protein [Ardenticatenaceae bacterium]
MTIPTVPDLIAQVNSNINPQMGDDNGRSLYSRERYGRILFFFGSVIAHVILWDLIGGRIPLLRNWVRSTRPTRFRRWARRFRGLAVDMGGVMIKLGQFLSSRVDVLPPEITEELQGLQDEVPAESFAHIAEVLQAELGDIDERFAYFDEKPLAAASLGQAHRARLYPNALGESEVVVVKVQRPHIEQIVQTDLSALQLVARWIMHYRPIGRRANVPALMDEFAVTLWEELDYTSEVDNAERFAKIYASTDYVYIPAVYREHCTARVIVLEDVESIKITDTVQMTAVGINPAQVADLLLDAYFEQFFRQGFFHADPHPGNLFVRPRPDVVWPSGNGSGPPSGRPFRIIFIDFGMVGHIPDLMGKNLRQLLVSVTQRDAEQLTDAYNNLGFFLPGADLERITEAQETLLDQIWGRNLLDLAQPDPKEIQELGKEFRDILFDFPFQIPQDFIYLGRALGMVSGLVAQLDPEINPWHKVEQYGRELIRTEQQAQDFTREALLNLIRPYLEVPGRVRRIIEAAEKGKLKVQSVPARETQQQLDRIDRHIGQLSWSILGAAGMISAALLYLGRKKE